MQFILTISSPPFEVSLSASEAELTATLKGHQTYYLTKEQITCGVLGNLSHQALIAKIHSIRTSHIAAFALPQDHPKELWIFEAVPLAACAIKQGREHLEHERYKQALKQFQTAIHWQRKQGQETAELEKAVSFVQQKRAAVKCRQSALRYLPNEKEAKCFKEILATYEAQDDLYACLQDLLAIEAPLLPHQHLLAALIHERQQAWQSAIEAYLLLADHNPHAKECIAKAYSIIEQAQLSERKDAVQMAFEEAVVTLKQASSLSSPTCFICFDATEQDVSAWLEKTLVPTLDLAGIQPIICLQQIQRGQDLSHFHEMARHADLAIIVCTPELKAKYDKQQITGPSQEIRLIKERFSDKAGTIFPIYLKGTKEQALPSAYFEPICASYFTMQPCHLDDLSQSLELIAAMRQVPKAKVRSIDEDFIQAIKPLLLGKIDPKALHAWQKAQKERIQALPAQMARLVAQLTTCMHVPRLPLDFTGREEELQALRVACCQTQRVAITGLGGVGKTALALKYAHAFQANYSLIHFMPAGTAQLLCDGLLKLADTLLGLDVSHAEERLAKLKNALEISEKNYLLILDGIDQEEALAAMTKYLPERSGHIIVTSRLPEDCRQWGWQSISIASLPLDDATAYLLKATHSQEQNHAQLLAKKLGQLPLALTHAASYMRRSKMSMQAYLQLFDQLQIQLFEKPYLKLKPGEKTILTTWQVSLNAIVNQHHCPLAQELLNFCAFLGQTSIPFDLIAKWFFLSRSTSLLEKATRVWQHLWFKAAHPSSPELAIRHALAYLIDYSMLTSPSPDAYTIHPVVQQVIRYQLTQAEQKTYLSQALQVCLAIGQNLDLEKLNVRRQLAPYQPHFRAVAHHLDQAGDHSLINLLQSIWWYDYYDGRYQELEFTARACLKLSQTPEEKAKSLHKLGLSLQQIGKQQDALKYQIQALELMKKLLGNKHHNVATSLNNVGFTLSQLGQHQEALKYQRQALELIKELLGKKHPDVATSLNNVGSTLGKLGQHQEALKYQRQALELIKELLGDKHPHLAASLNNVGSTLGKLGQHQEALEYQKQALELMKELLGDKHPHVAASLNNVGSTLSQLGRHQEALEYQRQALELTKELLGDKHPDVATSLNNVGWALSQLGQHQEALKYQMQALELIKEFLGDKHPDVAASLTNVGLTLSQLGRHQEALKYQKQALELRQELLGDKHPDVATSLNNVGWALSQLDQHQEALKYQRQALELTKELLGDKHPHVATSLNSMGLTLSQLGQHQEALKCLLQALKLMKELLGDKHPDVAASINNMGWTLSQLGRHQEALEYQRQALELRQERLGDKHPHVAASLNNVGWTLGQLGRYEEALKYQMQALELMKELLGDKHPDVATSLNNVGLTLSQLGQHQEALKHQRQALELRQELLGDKHPDVATSLNNVGGTLSRLGRHQEALEYQRQALELTKELLGNKHPHVTTSLNNVGWTLSQLDRHQEALEYQRQALELRQELLGDKHPDVALSLDNVGLTLGQLGRHQEALKYQMQALALKKELLGDKHPDVATSLDYVGLTSSELGQHEEALNYLMQVLELRKEILGDKHLDVAISLNNVALILGKLGQHQEALNYLMQALALKKELLGDKHPDVATSLNNVGGTLDCLGLPEEALTYNMQALTLWQEALEKKQPHVVKILDNVVAILRQLGRHQEALQYQMQALALKKELIGDKHPDVAINLDYIELTLSELGQHEEALKHLMQALELRKEILGDKHLDVAISLNNVAFILGKLGLYQEALKYQRQTLELKKELLGDKHPDVATCFDNVGLTLGKLGQHEEALKYQRQALEIRKEILEDKQP